MLIRHWLSGITWKLNGHWIRRRRLARLRERRDFRVSRQAACIDVLEERALLASAFDGQTLLVPGSPGQAANYRIVFTARDAAFVSEMGVYLADDDQGRVGGQLPGSPGFTEAVLRSGNRQRLFAGSEPAGTSRDLTFHTGDRVSFYFIQNQTTEGLLRFNPQNRLDRGSIAFFSNAAANPDHFNHVRSTTLSDDSFRLSWEDLTGGGDRDFNDEVLTITRLTPVTIPPVSPPPGQVFQATGAAGQTVPIRLTLTQRNAGYDSELGIISVDDDEGRIGGLSPGQPGYAQAAFASGRQQTAFPPGTPVGTTTTINLPAGARFMLFGIQNSNSANHIAQNVGNSTGLPAPAFFGIDAANPDGGTGHFRSLGSGEFGFEDLLFGGDRDYNDLVMRVEILPAFTPTPPVPVVTAQLVNDTGASGTDNVTSDAVVRGTATGTNPVVALEAAFENGSSLVFQNVSNRLVNGTYVLTSADLATVRGAPLTDGQYKLHVRARDSAGTLSSNAILTFTLDTTVAAPGLALQDDTGTSSTDRTTSDATIQGTATDPNGITLLEAAFVTGNGAPAFQNVTAKLLNGAFVLTPADLAALRGSPLPDGTYKVVTRVLDGAGNLSAISELVTTLDTTGSIAAVKAGSEDGDAPDFVDVTFNETVGPSAFTTDPYTLTIVGGVDDGQTIPIQSVSQLAPNAARLHLASPLEADNYLLTFGSANQGAGLSAQAVGDSVTDLAGNPAAVTGGLRFSATSKLAPSLFISTTIPTTVAGASLGTITVKVLTPQGAISNDDNGGNVTLYVSHNASDDPNGAKFLNDQNQLVDSITVQVQNGVATFNNVRLTKSGVGFILTAQAANRQIKSADSNRFIITAGVANKIDFQNQPTVAIVGQTINSGGRVAPFAATGVTVEILDQFGNRVLDSTAVVKISLTANPTGAILAGSPPDGIAAVNGLAVFPGLNLDKAGTGYTLTAEADGLGTKVTDSFSVLATNPTITFLDSSGQPTTNPIGTGPFAVGSRLPTIIVDADGLAGVEMTLGPPGRLFGQTIVTTAFDSQLNKTVAKFENVFIGKGTAGEQLTLQARFVSLPFAVANATTPMTLAAGQAAQLLIAGGGEIKTVTAGTPITLKSGAAIQVFVQDIYGNTVTTGPASTAEIWIGVNRAKPNSLTTPIGNHDDPTGASFGTYVKVNAVAGVATFANLFINRASTDYQLAVGTPDFGVNTDTSKPFDITIGAPAQLNFLVAPDTAERGAYQRITGQGNQVMVGVQDRVGNVVTGDTGRPITMNLAANGDPGKAELKGRTTVNTQNGVAVFDLLYITDQNETPIPGFQLRASTNGLPDSPIAAPFPLAASPGGIGRTIPQPIFEAVTTQGSVGVNQPLSFSYKVSAPSTPANAYDGALNVLLQLLNADGTSATGVFIGNSDKKSKTSVNGNIVFGDGLVITQPGSYRIRALLDVLPQNLPDGEIISAPFTVTAAVINSINSADDLLSTQSLGGIGNSSSVLDLDLASFTENFDFIKAFPAYKFLPTGADQPLSQQFQPPSLPLAPGAIQAPPMLQPNVTTASITDTEKFTQVPQSTKWWSSLMFQRTTVDNAPEVPQDSQGNQLFPLFADPLAAMVNSASTFAGIGLAHPTQAFVVPAGDTVGGDPGLPDMRKPGNVQYLYKYDSAADPRAYQDFSIGLKNLTGAQADATILRYTDTTVTLDWNHQLQATLGEGLPFVNFQTKNITGQTAMQLVTRTDKVVTIKAFNSAGVQVTSGDGTDGGIRLEISYSVADKAFPGSNTDVVINVVNNYGLFLPAGVSWTLANGTITADLTPSDATKNFFTVAILPDVPASITDPAAIQAFLNQAFLFYKARAFAFVTGSTAGFNFDQMSGKVTTTYELQTTQKVTGAGQTNSPLQALYPNQWLALYPDATGFATDPNTTYTYQVARGTLNVWDGPVFATTLQYRGVLPLVPPMPEDGTSHASLWHDQILPYLVGISSESTFDGSLSLDLLIPYGQNNYLDFQSMLGAAQLVPILVEISESQDAGLTDLDREQALQSAQKIFEIVKGRMGAWLSAKDDQALQLLYYQPGQLQESNAPQGIGWQALLSEAPGFLSSESLNDQNLIYGYLIKTAAIINMYDSQWADTRTTVQDGNNTTTFAGKYGEIVNRIIDNVANYDRDNTDFPFLRNFDVAQGHSWADGAANGLLGTNMESSSEAINFASSLIQWGEATGNQYIRDLGVSLYTHEVASVNLYYFNNPGPFFKIKPGTVTNAFTSAFTNNPSPPPTGDNRPSITILHNSSMGISGGFVGDIPAAQAGIQIVPLTGASLYLGSNTAFVKANADFAMSNLTQAGGIPVKPAVYLSVLDPYLAFLNAPYNGQTALQRYTSDLAKIVPINRGVPIDTAAFNIHFIKAISAYGQVDTSVTSNAVSYAVFIKNPADVNTRTYIAYNPNATPMQVTFSDGFPMTVPGRSTLVASKTNAEVATQTFPDLSVETPVNRFFLSSNQDAGSNLYTFLSGQTGTGEKSIDIPPPALVSATIADSPTGVTSVAGNGQGSIVTVTTTAAHGFYVGQKLQIAGVGVAAYNGSFVIASVPTPTSFTFNSSQAPQAASGGGSASSINHFNAPTDATQKITLQITGLTGSLISDNAQAFYSLWVDPQYPLPATPGGASPETAYIRVQITYQDGSVADGGTGQTIYHLYDGFSLGNNPGFVNGVSVQNGAVIGHPEPVAAPYIPGVQPLLSKLTNATVTVEIWARDGNNAKDGSGNPIPIRLRTDAVAEQGRVSYFDLPYDFSQINGQFVNSLVLSPPPVVPTT